MRFYIIHNGCEPTLFEAERIKQVLTNEGFTYSNAKLANVIIFLCCTFTAQKEKETNDLILKYKNHYKTLIVTGCFLQKERLEGEIKYVKLKNLLPFLTHNKEVENVNAKTPFVKISEGCTGLCSFCTIKNVKGKHYSIAPNEIMQQIEFLSDNYDKIKLVGQDIAAYGTDIGSSLYNLLTDILTTFSTIKIELGSLNPKHLKEFEKKELELLVSERITGNILIPVQSASNRILEQMQREYMIEDFQNLYDTLHTLGIQNISTDIIAGFPSETEEEHLLNLNLLSDNYFSFAEIFMYETRPATLAAKMEQIPLDLRKRRTSELIAQHINTYSKHNNIDFEYLVENEQIFNTNIIFKQ